MHHQQRDTGTHTNTPARMPPVRSATNPLDGPTPTNTCSVARSMSCDHSRTLTFCHSRTHTHTYSRAHGHLVAWIKAHSTPTPACTAEGTGTDTDAATQTENHTYPDTDTAGFASPTTDKGNCVHTHTRQATGHSPHAHTHADVRTDASFTEAAAKRSHSTSYTPIRQVRLVND